MKRMAVIFNSDYQNWPMGGTISYVTQTVALLSDTFEIDLWGCSVDGKSPESVTIDRICYPISVCANAKEHRKIVPNVVRCFWGNLVHGSAFSAEHYDILYFHLSASELGWLLGHKLRSLLPGSGRRPLVVMHQHGMAYQNKVGNWLNYQAMNHADVVFFTTDRQSLAQHRKNIHHSNVVWMPSMVDMDFFCPVSHEQKMELRRQYGIDEDKNVFIYTGRITGWKNPLLLLDAFEQYQQATGGKGCLLYVGDGEMTDQLRRAVSQKRLDDAVRLTGRMSRTELRDCLRLSDFFLLPSKGEGVSVSTIEAMSVGLGVVAFQVEGMAGLIDERSGILVAEQSSGAFAGAMDAVTRLHLDPRGAVTDYSVDSVKAHMIHHLQKALESKGKKQC